MPSLLMWTQNRPAPSRVSRRVPMLPASRYRGQLRLYRIRTA
jgi:hypothetical protein